MSIEDETRNLNYSKLQFQKNDFWYRVREGTKSSRADTGF